MMKITYKKLIISMSFIFMGGLLTACGEDLFAGGASLGGSGNPTKPGKPGDYETPADGEKGDSKDNEIWLPAPVEDDCNGLHRKLQFLNNVTREPIEKETVFKYAQQLTLNGTLALQITQTNKGLEKIQEQQPACYVPLELYLFGNTKRSYPENECKEIQTYEYQPNETKTFIVNYPAFEVMNGTWKYGLESTYLKNEQELKQCEPLTIQFKISAPPESIKIN